MLRRACFAVLLAFALVGSAAGADARFEAALADWLADSDDRALPALAALAREGHGEAQILLALIDRLPETHAPWLAALRPAERRALMRAPDGRSWMAQAPGSLAALWRAAWMADMPGEVALAFAQEGEARAARVALLAREARQQGGFADLARNPHYPDTMRFLAWAEAPRSVGDRAGLAPGDPQRGRVSGADLRRWLLGAPAAAPVARFCRAACPADPADCVEAAYHALGGYRGLLVLGSPAASIVPEAAWVESAKGMRAVPRRIALRRPPSLSLPLPEGCLAQSVALTP